MSSDASATAKVGDTARVHYTCRLEDGSVFATTRNKDPLEFVIGKAQVIPGLQEAVVGMSPGETRTITVPPEKAYGPYHEEMTAILGRDMIPDQIDVKPGVSLRVKHADGHESDVLVTDISGENIRVDGNHPLAGKNLVMEIELIELTPAST